MMTIEGMIIFFFRSRKEFSPSFLSKREETMVFLLHVPVTTVVTLSVEMYTGERERPLLCVAQTLYYCTNAEHKVEWVL